MSTNAALLAVEDLVRDYVLPRRRLREPPRRRRVLHGVSLEIAAGHSLGLVGESGCGKSTLARAAMALERPDGGRVAWLGRDLGELSGSELRRWRQHFQMVFQDPFGSLDPRHRVGRIVAEPLTTLGRLIQAEKDDRVAQALDAVGLRRRDAGRLPHEFSGGQRQRIAIARALVTRPKLIVADEPVSALDVSIQAQILNLMHDLKEQCELSWLFISHDLSVVRYVTDGIAVMFLGRIVETGPTESVFVDPAHPYTRALLEAVPRPEPSRRRSRVAAGEGTVSSAPESAPAPGCPYAPRCPLAEARCREELPALRTVDEGRQVACHLV